MSVRSEILYVDNTRQRKIRNSIFKIAVILLSVITISPIILIISKLIIEGIGQINFDFFTQLAPDTFQAMSAKINGMPTLYAI